MLCDHLLADRLADRRPYRLTIGVPDHLGPHHITVDIANHLGSHYVAVGIADPEPDLEPDTKPDQPAYDLAVERPVQCI